VEVRGAIDRIDAVNIMAIEQVEDFGAGLRFQSIAYVEHSLQAHISGMGGIAKISVAPDVADAV